MTNNIQTYLGIPNFIGKAKNLPFHYLIDRLRQNLNTWEKFKVIAQAVPTYIMRSFLIPKVICKIIKQMMTIF